MVASARNPIGLTLLVVLVLNTAFQLAIAGDIKKHVIERAHPEGIVALAFTANNRRLVSASSDGTIKTWDPEKYREETSFQVPAEKRHLLVLSPDGKTVASRSQNWRTVFLWDVQSGKQLSEFEGHPVSVQCMAFTPDGKTVACGSMDDEKVHLWSITAEPPRRSQTTQLPRSIPTFFLRFSADGKTLVAFGGGTCVSWSVEKGELLATTGGPPHTKSFSMTSDAEVMAMVGPSGIWLREWRVPNPSRSVFTDPSRLTAIAFSPDDKTLASTSFEGTVRLWDVATGKSSVIHTFGGRLSSVTFSPDGKLLATGTDRRDGVELALFRLRD
jgi:WD40 repeat protein